ncbi:MAG TPA: LacI family DNA-binding transcriptional regulator, partial [Nocardioides sp.]|nr:LacI family DNA-binding transcriptional regulator [Nocardioides sp.]
MVNAKRSVSVKDVATRAGVALGTVSNVLNRPDRVGPATRARVEQAIAEQACGRQFEIRR